MARRYYRLIAALDDYIPDFNKIAFTIPFHYFVNIVPLGRDLGPPDYWAEQGYDHYSGLSEADVVLFI